MPANQRTRNSNLIVFGFGVLLSLFGLYGLWVPWSSILLSQPVEMTITNAGLEQSIKITDHHIDMAHSGYKPTVEYHYHYNGKDYQGKSIWAPPAKLPGMKTIDQTGSLDWANSLIKSFHPNQKVIGYVDPRNPSAGFLIKDFNHQPVLYLYMAAFLFLFLILKKWLIQAFQKKPGDSA